MAQNEPPHQDLLCLQIQIFLSMALKVLVHMILCVVGLIPGLATNFCFSFCFFKKGSYQLLAKVCARTTGKPLRRSKPAQEKCG